MSKNEKSAEKLEEKPQDLAPYTIAKGKSVTSKKGILGEGKEVKVEFLAGGKDSLDALVRAGFVTENK